MASSTASSAAAAAFAVEVGAVQTADATFVEAASGRRFAKKFKVIKRKIKKIDENFISFFYKFKNSP